MPCSPRAQSASLTPRFSGTAHTGATRGVALIFWSGRHRWYQLTAKLSRCRVFVLRAGRCGPTLTRRCAKHAFLSRPPHVPGSRMQRPSSSHLVGSCSTAPESQVQIPTKSPPARSSAHRGLPTPAQMHWHELKWNSARAGIVVLTEEDIDRFASSHSIWFASRSGQGPMCRERQNPPLRSFCHLSQGSQHSSWTQHTWPRSTTGFARRSLSSTRDFDSSIPLTSSCSHGSMTCIVPCAQLRGSAIHWQGLSFHGLRVCPSRRCHRVSRGCCRLLLSQSFALN